MTTRKHTADVAEAFRFMQCQVQNALRYGDINKVQYADCATEIWRLFALSGEEVKA